MRVLPGAVVAEARRCLTQGVPEHGLRSGWWRGGVRLSTLACVLGSILGAAYAHLLVHGAGLPAYVACGLGGALAGYVLLAIPHLTWNVLRRQWVALALRLSRRRLGDLARAAAEAIEKAAQDPAYPPGRLALDMAAVSCLAGDYQAAANRLRPLYRDRRSRALANNLLVSLAEMGRWDEAARLLKQEFDFIGHLDDPVLARIAAQAPQGPLLDSLFTYAENGLYPHTLTNLGVRFLRQGDWVRAEDALARAVELESGMALSHANLGVLAYRRGEFAEAATATARAAELEPSNEVIHTNLGAMLCHRGQQRAARRVLRRACNLAPTSVEPLVNLANAYALEGRHAEALGRHVQTTRLAASPEAHHNAALLLCLREHREAALKEQTAAHALAPEDPDVTNNLGCLLWLRGKYGEAREHFEHAARKLYHFAAKANVIRAEIAAGRADRGLHTLLQTSYPEEDRDFDRGVAHLVTALQRHAEGGSASEAHQEHLEEADAHFRKVIARGKGPVTAAYVNLGIVEYQNGNHGRAAEAFAEADGRLPTNTEYAYAIATCYVTEAAAIMSAKGYGYEPPTGQALDLLRRAQPYLEKALKVKEVADAAHLNLGVLHYVLGDYQAAVAVLRPIVRPDSPWELINIMAIAHARRARALHVSVQSDPLVRALRKHFVETEVDRLLSTAIHYFDQVLRHQPHNIFAHANTGLAQFLRNRGDDVERALHHWQRMRQTGGELAQQMYDRFTSMATPGDSARLQFQDVEIEFQPLRPSDWVVTAPPRLSGLQYVVRELMDTPAPRLRAEHPAVKRALDCQERVDRLQAALRRLG
jgi:tetratricopeptide (TPR) repeat protein